MFNKALVVDDNYYNRDIARMALENAGYDVTEAEDGIKALNLLKSELYDLMILDMAMPELDGTGVIVELRKHPQHQQMKIVVVTAHAHMTDGVQVDADFVMYKPIDIQFFATFLRRLKPASV
jgi:CheY-like chemotaxis protein